MQSQVELSNWNCRITHEFTFSTAVVNKFDPSRNSLFADMRRKENKRKKMEDGKIKDKKKEKRV